MGDIKFAAGLSVCLSVYLLQTAERKDWKFTQGRRFVLDIASRILVSIVPGSRQGGRKYTI